MFGLRLGRLMNIVQVLLNNHSSTPLGRWNNVGKNCDKIFLIKDSSKEKRVNLRALGQDPFATMRRTVQQN